jgi:NADPH:quinone reductase-like Zn-dependent oxidoreductase
MFCCACCLNCVLIPTQSYDELAVSQVEVPSVPEGHVLVKIKAVGLNFVDLLYVGRYFSL